MKSCKTYDVFEALLDSDVLSAHAKRGGFFSYAAGSAAAVLSRFPHRCAEIQATDVVVDCFECTLPVGKGLSSSAAICCTVIHAFNQLFDLGLSENDVFHLAYDGERLTPSLCGKMDQCVAFGTNTCLHMKFDADSVDVTPIRVKGRFHFVVANLNRHKDTPLILRSLQEAYPHPKNELHQKVHLYLGPINDKILSDAVRALETGNSVLLGELMLQAQEHFDSHLRDVCPVELSSPRLHEVLADPYLRQVTTGGKGVGSQGDGSVQFVCKTKLDQERAVERLHQLGCSPMSCDVTGDE
jgi:galactokinase